MVALPYRWDNPDLNDKIDTYNAFLKYKTDKIPQVKIVDTSSFQQDRNAYYMKDKLHLNNQGKDLLARRAYRYRSCKFSQSQIPSREVNLPKSQERRANKRVSNLNCITPATLKDRCNPNSNLIDILCWNIRGISTKLQDKRVRDYLSKFSIIGFVETMKDKHFALNINGFEYYTFPCKYRHSKAKRASRGIGILIAN